MCSLCVPLNLEICQPADASPRTGGEAGAMHGGPKVT